MKHAYLILAHNEPEQLQRLIRELDDARNDIFIHWDANSGNKPELSTNLSGLYFVEKPVKVFWADYSMVEAELALFELALNKGRYSYFHLLSGVDIPVKSQDFIHKYCDEHQGMEFIGFSNPREGEIKWRTQHYFLFPKNLRKPSPAKRIIRAAAIKIQDIVGYHRTDIEVRKGPQWFSATESFIRYIIEHKDDIEKSFNHTFAPDELFIQSFCWNSPFRDKLYNSQDEWKGCKRYIKWIDGELLPLTISDIPAMFDSEMWFARKATNNYEELISAINEKINEQDISNNPGI